MKKIANLIKNRINMIALCVVCVGSLCGCNTQTQNELTDDSWKDNKAITMVKEDNTLELDQSFLVGDVADIVQRGRLVVGMLQIQDNTLYSSRNGDVYAGVDPYYAGILADGLGVELEIDASYHTYEELIKALLDDDIDLIISGMSITNERAKYINFSEPYLPSNLALMCHKSVLVENDAIEDPISYIRNHNVVIGVTKDACYVSQLEEYFPNAEIVYSDSREELVKLVAEGSIFAFAENDASFIYYSAKYPELTLHTQVYVLEDKRDDIAIGVSPVDVNLLNYVNVCIASDPMTRDDLDELCRYSFGFY